MDNSESKMQPSYSRLPKYFYFQALQCCVKSLILDPVIITSANWVNQICRFYKFR